MTGSRPTSTSSTTEPSGGDGLLEVGRVVRAHGLQGAVVVELSSNREERVAPGSQLVVEWPGASGDGPRRDTLTVVSARPLPPPSGRPVTRWLVCIEGVGRREDAEALRGARLLGEPVADADEEALWVHELIGSIVEDLHGVAVGVVTAVLANPASDLLELDDGSLVPLVFVRERSAGRIVVDAPPGLIG